MFSFLKKKLKEAVSKISKKVESEPTEPPIVIKEVSSKEKLQAEIENKSFLKKIKEKVTTKRISEEKFEELFYELELALLENNVALEVVDKIKQDLKIDLVNIPLERKDTSELIKNSLKKTLEDVFIEPFDLIKKIDKKAFTILFVGINGSGKTTSIAKLAYLLEKNKKKCVIAASDTFRAASIEQLQEHATNLRIKLIKHDYGSDPAAVAYDAKSYAQSHNLDVVLIDTAGRQHSNKNLLDELKKIKRVILPDLTIFVGEAITGNDCIEQAKKFNDTINIDAIILTKQDIDEKGGTSISISYVTQKPILFIGTGQQYKDFETFSKDKILEKIEL